MAGLVSHGQQLVMMKLHSKSCLSMEPILTSRTFEVRYLFITPEMSHAASDFLTMAQALAYTICGDDRGDGTLNTLKLVEMGIDVTATDYAGDTTFIDVDFYGCKAQSIYPLCIVLTG